MRISIFALVLASAFTASAVSQAQNVALAVRPVDLPHATAPVASSQHIVDVNLGASLAPNALVATPKLTPVNLAPPIVEPAPKPNNTTDFRRMTLKSYMASKKQG